MNPFSTAASAFSIEDPAAPITAITKEKEEEKAS